MSIANRIPRYSKSPEEKNQKFIAILKYLIFYWVMYLYTDTFGIAKWNTEQLTMEVPLVLYLYFLLNGIVKNDRFRHVVAAVPIAVVYIIHDLYFFIFAKLPRFIEVRELPELINVLDVMHLSLSLLFFIPLGVFFLQCDKRKLKVFLVRSIPLAIVLFLLLHAPENLAGYIEKAGYINEWSEERIVKKNGRIVTAIYNEAKRRYAHNQLTNYRDGTKLKLKLSARILDKINNRNIHVIVLESFVDPRWFRNIQFNIDPADDSFTQLINNKIGSSLSPVFGGGTAQAEFEILCGVPAFREIGGVEFNMFTGSTTYCLPEILKKAGYTTVMTNAYKPYYNAMNAYKGLGFEEIHFPKEYVPKNDTYLKLDDTPGGLLFDGSLLRQNRDFISEKIPKGSPLFNYIIGIYGHIDFERDEEKRPSVIKTNASVPEIDRIANQFRERTTAIAEFIHTITTIDRNSMIIVVSDHLPPLNIRRNVYQELGYLNNIPDALLHTPLIVIQNGEAVQYENFYHFNIYRLILDYLTDGHYCREYDCNMDSRKKSDYYNDYLTILGLASR